MTETETRKARNDWIGTEEGRTRFWTAADEHGLEREEIYTRFEVETLHDYEGDLGTALATLQALADEKAAAAGEETTLEEIQHAALPDAPVVAWTADSYRDRCAALPEAPTVAWTKFQKGPGLPEWSFTIRAGLMGEEADFAIRETLRLVERVEGWLERNSYHAIYDGRSQMGQVISAPPAPSPKAPGNSQPPSPPPSPASPPSPAPATGKPPAGPGQPPQGGAVPSNGSETFIAEVVTAHTSPNGNRYYAVKGDRYKKHGVTAWPEVAEPQLEAITGYNPAGLKINDPWDVAGFRIQVTGDIPEGKKYMGKVASFAPSP